MRFALIFLLLVAGCVNPRLVSETGIVHPRLNIDTRPTCETFEGVIQTVRVEDRVLDLGPVGFEFGTGPEFIFPTAEHSEAVAWDLSLRVVYAESDWIQPYIFAAQGMFQALDTWEPQGSSWGFTTHLGFGVRCRVAEKWWVGADYREWHESNGSGVYNHGYIPNPGFESGSVWIGVTYEW